ncbi:malignant fibrous histiocytoma-amplified sequence 1 homolog [Patella vulgata]|uniref:malignant fibrous histiocytoma-amplified sequence 1 homolog n=1 Tax=Patella vulgata TaxID=6465 RepID=UPI0021802E60|nr:malignant fibrous histiocytoma-amplified sequence 1 homolog [Patella vulgata]XP_050418497.1 malignant fibrous histiocytoma-amplified sequence 1 homolog [Patella vulgata]
MDSPTTSQASETLKKFLLTDRNGKRILNIPEGFYKGWIPKALYTYQVDELYVPFLKLFSFPVAGTALGSLKDMLIFHAIGNYLYKLPKSFDQCSLITDLNLGFNHFSEIPTAVYNLTTLIELSFAENYIESIAPEIGKLTNLRVLNLSGNCLSEVPDELSRLKKLQILNLAGKWYPRGGLELVPLPVCSLPELQELDLSWQKIHTIPDQFGNLRKLRIFNLRGNFLMYVSMKIHNCEKLVNLNLTGALRYCSVIPEALFTLEELRTINLSGNFFTEIPSKVCELRKLRVLIMQRNALLRLPVELFSLRHLEVLEFGENYIEKLPDGISNLKQLKFLGMERNCLHDIPDEICRCQSLITLHLGSNKLDKVPELIYQLKNLSDLSLNDNNLTELPLLLDRLEKLKLSECLHLWNNKLKRPPQAICDQGVHALFPFLQELRISEAKHRKKMILIGAVKAGKTSLRHALTLGHSHLTAEHERTWVLERHLWEPRSELRVQILDFGGHHIYSAAHHMFLTPEALHLLVFDLSKYTSEEYDELIGNWLEAIMDRAPGARIKIVGTHADLCNSQDISEKVEDILRKIHKNEKTNLDDLKNEIARIQKILDMPEARLNRGEFTEIGLERLKEKRNHMEKILSSRSALPHSIQIVSCAKDLEGLDEFRAGLINDLTETEEMALPKSWYRFLQEIQAHQERILPWNEALHIFIRVMGSFNQSMIAMGGSPDLSMIMVLMYLHRMGEIVWYDKNPKLRSIIFHRPETLVEMLRAVFRHNFKEIVVFEDIHGNSAGLTRNRFDSLKEDFLEEGLMSYELLHYCLLHFDLSSDDLDTFISLMLKFDLCFEVTKSALSPNRLASVCILQFPWFFKPEMPDSVQNAWPERTPQNQFELCYHLHFTNKRPPHFFAKFSVRLHNYFTDRINWKYGVLGRKNLSKVLVKRKTVDGSTFVSVSVRGSDLQEMWGLILKTKSDLLNLLQEWPFIRFELSLVCSHCILHNIEDPFRFPGEVLQLTVPKNVYVANWCKKAQNKDIPACFVYPLDQEDQVDLQKHMKAATEFLMSSLTLDDVDGMSCKSVLLSEAGLAFIASDLGFNWSLVMGQLGIAQSHIEVIQLDNPNQTYKQILNCLRKWKDSSNNSDDDKIEELLRVLGSDEIGRMDIVEKIRDKFQL